MTQQNLTGHPTLEALAATGDHWNKGRRATALAVGTLGHEQVIGVARGAGDNARVAVYRYDAGPGPTRGFLDTVASAGEHWGEERYAQALGFAEVDGRTYLGAGRNAGGNAKVIVYRLEDDELEAVATAGEGWGRERGATGVDLLADGHDLLVAVARSHGGNDRVVVYRLAAGADELEVLATAGRGWGRERGGTDLAFGRVGDDLLLAVGRDDGAHERLFLYRLDVHAGRLEKLDATGGSWSEDRFTTALAFGELDGRTVLGMTRNAGGNARVAVYDPSGGELRRIAALGESWDDRYGGTAVAFGKFDAHPALAVTRSDGSGARVVVYQWRDGRFVEVATGGDHWHAEIEGTGVGFGRSSHQDWLAVSRSARSNDRVVVYAA